MTCYFRFALAAAIFLSAPVWSFAKDGQWSGPGRAALKAFVVKEHGLLKAEGPDGKELSVAFYGDFNGDGQEDAILFIYIPIVRAAGNVNLDVALFKGENGKYKFMRYAKDIYGEDPRDAVFSDGEVKITMNTLGENDGRCCPTKVTKFTIKTK